MLKDYIEANKNIGPLAVNKNKYIIGYCQNLFVKMIPAISCRKYLY